MKKVITYRTMYIKGQKWIIDIVEDLDNGINIIRKQWSQFIIWSDIRKIQF